MALSDWKDRLKDAIETDNPPGTDYYGAEVDEDEVEADRKRMEEHARTLEENKLPNKGLNESR